MSAADSDSETLDDGISVISRAASQAKIQTAAEQNEKFKRKEKVKE